MSIRYKRLHGKTEPILVEYDGDGPGGKDADGETVYVNTHWLTMDDCWRDILTDYKAGVSLTTRDVIRLRAQLAAAEKQLCDEQILLHESTENYERWQNKQMSTDSAQALADRAFGSEM